MEAATEIHVCEVCGLPRHRQATLCRRCRVLRNRPEHRKGWTKDGAAREKRMHKQWDEKIGAFRCAYTGLPLTTERDADGRAGPMFATWEHVDPRSPTKASDVVLVGWLVNDMKTDLNEREFTKMVRGLAARLALRSRLSTRTRCLATGTEAVRSHLTRSSDPGGHPSASPRRVAGRPPRPGSALGSGCRRAPCSASPRCPPRQPTGATWRLRAAACGT